VDDPGSRVVRGAHPRPDASDEATAESFEIISGILAPGSELDIVSRAVDDLDP
jgi:hypothetical protein